MAMQIQGRNDRHIGSDALPGHREHGPVGIVPFRAEARSVLANVDAVDPA